MKLIIDISKATQKIIHDHGEVGIHMSAEKLLEAIQDSIPLDHVFNTIKDGIKEEADYAYADFEQYKADVLNAEADELPDDDFRYGMERAIEIINAYRKVVSS